MLCTKWIFMEIVSVCDDRMNQQQLLTNKEQQQQHSYIKEEKPMKPQNRDWRVVWLVKWCSYDFIFGVKILILKVETMLDVNANDMVLNKTTSTNWGESNVIVMLYFEMIQLSYLLWSGYIACGRYKCDDGKMSFVCEMHQRYEKCVINCGGCSWLEFCLYIEYIDIRQGVGYSIFFTNLES
ncbi:hypothetical protein PPL_07183 [Heterostelium album PN500]|uniref:Uncharacterized protein n=1 Tax=Heterostelium pallidum (strain ATCC 26659 / Pp 5 / PN500) TaxID=670386 RepID=D3BEL9_HETP5|nr:hypothetical protein PPL_07183 [Heterostelium album PN500]EFA80350.1 hypothetical protein PPL_07183 [Heterostelium album PN500]|eukprot:XP_020432470.1 hypothetical protein PPL_07183 [Heterostelium album PN500]